ncbi:MAG: hypothetical protein WDZ82_03670 [Candidatus Paceibacterota bacterium]
MSTPQHIRSLLGMKKVAEKQLREQEQNPDRRGGEPEAIGTIAKRELDRVIHEHRKASN